MNRRLYDDAGFLDRAAWSGDTTRQTGVLATSCIVVLPFAIVLCYSILIGLPVTRRFASWLVEESRPVELLTFIFLAWAGAWAMKLAARARRLEKDPLVSVFLAIFALGMLLVAMEEIAWGQWLLGFKTPELFQRINAQGEVTLHNIHGPHGHGNAFRMVYGLGGLCGVAVSYVPRFREIAAPLILLPYFLIIAGHSAFDLYNDVFYVPWFLDRAIEWFAEVIELMIGISALLYTWLKAKLLRRSMACGEANNWH
jgi:hypothetical protein